ncbi:hypothetical protein GCM10023340_15380 [Nocardioides marinquilinus]|uniref:Uncharacterized protein n=1 Tax=Nocardioides marinquilinus TaxID=1210400 RepID=A0ABP9PH75_9ACTN
MSNIARLDQALTAADDVQVDDGSTEWDTARQKLLVVVSAIRVAAKQGRGIGGRTGPKMFETMMVSADRLEHRAQQIGKGSGALTNSAKAIRNANKKRQAMETDPDLKPLTEEPYTAPQGGDLSESELRRQERLHRQGQAQLVAEREAKREARAAEIAAEFEDDYSEPIQIMKDIYGYQDPPPPPPADDTPFTPTGPGANTGAGSNTDSDIRGPGKNPEIKHPPPVITHPPVDEGPGLIPTGPPTDPPTTTYPPVGPPTGPPIDNGPELTPQPPPTIDSPRPDVPGTDVSIDGSTSSPGGLPPSVLGGIGAGVVGGATIAAGARGLGGLNSLVNQLSSRGAGTIGSSTTRGAVPGNLSRSAVSGTGSPTSRGTTGSSTRGAGGLRSGAGTAGGRGTGGRGAGGRGAGGRGAGGRGAGGRGAGGMGAGRGGRRKQDEEDRRNEPGFADADEWLDDDGAPPVLG